MVKLTWYNINTNILNSHTWNCSYICGFWKSFFQVCCWEFWVKLEKICFSEIILKFLTQCSSFCNFLVFWGLYVCLSQRQALLLIIKIRCIIYNFLLCCGSSFIVHVCYIYRYLVEKCIGFHYWWSCLPLISYTNYYLHINIYLGESMPILVKNSPLKRRK